jgi:uncharacterized protein YcbX
MIVDPKNKFITQREHGKMALIQPSFSFASDSKSAIFNEHEPSALILNAPDMPSISIPLATLNSLPVVDSNKKEEKKDSSEASKPELVTARVWSSSVESEVLGGKNHAIHAWLSKYLGTECSLVQIKNNPTGLTSTGLDAPEAHKRLIDNKFSLKNGVQVAYGSLLFFFLLPVLFDPCSPFLLFS